MNVPNQCKEIRFLLADHGSVSVLEEMPNATVPAIEGDGVSGQQPSHELRHAVWTGAQKKMSVVGKQRPGKTGGLSGRNQPCEPLDKIRAVLVASEDIPLLDPPHHHVVQNPRSVQARSAWHEGGYTMTEDEV